ncbi:hypothetical protein B0H11DRAFT_2286561 [Mycena galericulata]|nr:hypothetical protein B0H11DRAFT_2286561 [Mycena galericulata]
MKTAMATLTDVQPVAADTVVTAPCIGTLCSTPTAHLREDKKHMSSETSEKITIRNVVSGMNAPHTAPLRAASSKRLPASATCSSSADWSPSKTLGSGACCVGRSSARTARGTVEEIVLNTEISSQDPTETREPQRVVAACPNVQRLIVLGAMRSRPAWRWTLHVSEGLGSEPLAPAARNRYNRAQHLRDGVSAHGHPLSLRIVTLRATVPPPPTPCVCDWAMTAGGVGNSTDHVGYDGYAGVSGTDW